MIETIGILGAILLGGCGLPQAIKALRTGKADDVSWGFLSMWGIGEILMLIYALYPPTMPGTYILVANYLINLILIIPIVVVKARKNADSDR